ncbi:MAG: diguanylate cyclase [Bryobacterales bacterium]|nr:diguanylate cyclase [Bryobacterales bacterium]
MSRSAKLFIGAILLFGGMAWVHAFAEMSWSPGLRFVVFWIAALITSGWKIRIPGMQGTLSANFFYVLIGIVELSLIETMAIGSMSVLFQYVWRSQATVSVLRAAFNISNVSGAILMAYRVFHAPALIDLGLDFPLRLAIATCFYFVANTVPIAVVISLTENRPALSTWRDCYLWSFAYYMVGAAFAVMLHWGEAFVGWQTAMLVVPIIYITYRSYDLYLARLEAQQVQAEIQKSHAEEMAALHLRTIEALALAIEAKDQTTHDHLQRVQTYCREVGAEVGLPEPQMQALIAASLLHDIGKLAVPEHIISKPGRLTPEEFEKMKIHPVVGAEILERVQFPYPVVPIVRHHHEKWDGTGYPAGLKGEEIPIGSRILSAVDCLDALASDRQYRRALPLDEAIRIVDSESGKAFDPQIVEILKRRYRELERKARGASVVEPGKLSTEIRIKRGAAPAAGFEAAPPLREPEFLSTIHAAGQEAQKLLEISQQLVDSLSLPETMRRLADPLRKVVPFDCVALYLVRDRGLVTEFASGHDEALFSSLEIPLGQGLSGWVAETRKPIINGNPAVEPGYLNSPENYSLLQSALAVPLEGATRVLGTLALYHKGKDAFSRDHLRFVLGISSKLAISIENGLRYRIAEDSAGTDYLTELPNARALSLELESQVQIARRNGTALAVLVGDLDGFKAVNDRFGHLEGNRVLRSVAVKLKQRSRHGDFVARMGGDEFVCVLPGVGPSQGARMAQRFREAVEEAGRESFPPVPLSMSIGISYLPIHGLDADRLLAEADRLMYQDKETRDAAGLHALSAVLAKPAAAAAGDRAPLADSA